RHEQLLSGTRLPFGQGTDTLVTSYSNVAELNCLNILNYPIPQNLLCTYTETSAAINGLDIDGLTEKRPNILEACDLYDIPHMTKEHKARMRDLILNNTQYTEEQWHEIKNYNRKDVLEEGAVLEAITPTIDLPAALFRGRYAKAVSLMELRGLPVDVDYLRELETNWQALRMYYIARNDTFGLYDDDGSFCEGRLEALIQQRGWTSWPRTSTGKPETKSRTIGKQCKRHPELRQLQRL